MNTIKELKKEVETLKSLLNEKNVEISKKDSEISKEDEKIKELQVLNNWYIEKLKLRQKEKFAASSEKGESNQLTIFDLFNEAETLREPIVIEPTEETIIKEHKRKKSKRGKGFEKLEVETIEYKLTEEEQKCDKCGEKLTEMRQETRTELKIIPTKVSFVKHVTYVYACKSCDKNGIEGTIIKAESPKALISKSFVSPSVMAYIMNQKYANAMPLYRQEKEFGRLGVNISRQSLSNWIIKGAELLKPLQEELKKELLRNDILHADETVLEVLNEP